MSEPYYKYFIRSNWKGRAETPSDIGARFVETLAALSNIDPIFADWKVIDTHNMSSLPLSVARPRIATVVEDNVARDDDDEPSPAYGYHISAMTGGFKDPRTVNFRVEAGGKDASATRLEFGDFFVPPDPVIVAYPLVKAALLAINAVWLAPWACAQAFRSGAIEVPIDIGGVAVTSIQGVVQVPSDPTFPNSMFNIPWIAYLSAPLALELRLAPEILTERTSDGGLLMSATAERFDPTNPVHLRRSRILAETLIACTANYRP